MNSLDKNIQFVKGIGPKKAAKLNKLNIFTIRIYYIIFRDLMKIEVILKRYGN